MVIFHSKYVKLCLNIILTYFFIFAQEINNYLYRNKYNNYFLDFDDIAVVISRETHF